MAAMAFLLILLANAFGNAQTVSFRDKGADCYQRKDYPCALEYFLKAAEQEPDNDNIFNSLGFTCYYLGQFEEAVPYFRKSIQLREAYNNCQGLGMTYHLLDDYENSLKYLFKSTELDPSVGYTYYRIGLVFFDSCRFFDAVGYFKKANEFGIQKEIFFYLIKSYLFMDRTAEARDILLSRMEKSEDEEEKRTLQFLLAYIYAAEDRFDAAFEIFGKRSSLGCEIKKVKQGIKVNRIYKNGPADLSGLIAGDVLAEFNGMPLGDMDAGRFAKEIVGMAEFGSRAELRVIRGGLQKEITAYIGLTPDLKERILNDPQIQRQRAEMPPADQAAKINIAVIELDAFGIPRSEASAIADRLRSEIYYSNRYQVLERDKMQAILDEHGIQQAGLSSDATLIESGKLLNVRQIACGSVGKVGGTYSLSLRLIDVETGRILSVSTEDVQGDIGELMLHGVKNAAFELLR